MAHLLLRGTPLGPPGGGTTPIEAVLFDKDGTLSHSEPMLLALASARVDRTLSLAQEAGCGAEARSRLELLLRQAYGLRSQAIDPGGITAVAARDHNLIATATALAQVGLSWADALAIAEESFALTDGLHGAGSFAPPQPTAGLLALLERLGAAAVRCAVISNDHQQGIRTFLARHGMEGHFAAQWSAEHHPRKPAAGAVHGLCTALGVAAERCALIGDADSDLRMARAAGVPVVIGYRAGWRLPPQLEAGTPWIEHWDELEARATPLPSR
jgi:phosphoglycolate phosphatase